MDRWHSQLADVPGLLLTCVVQMHKAVISLQHQHVNKDTPCIAKLKEDDLERRCKGDLARRFKSELLDMPKSHTWCKYNEVNITPLIMCVSDLQKESSKVESRVLLAGIFVTALACIISAVARTIHRRLNNHYTLMP